MGMKTRRVFVLAVSIASLLGGCTTSSNQARVERLTRHPSWPRIQQIARAEVEQREKLLGWPDNAGYVPVEHKDKIWVVMAMAGTPDGSVQRAVTLTIGDDGTVLLYKRHWTGQR